MARCVIPRLVERGLRTGDTISANEAVFGKCTWNRLTCSKVKGNEFHSYDDRTSRTRAKARSVM